MTSPWGCIQAVGDISTFQKLFYGMKIGQLLLTEIWVKTWKLTQKEPRKTRGCPYWGKCIYWRIYGIYFWNTNNVQISREPHTHPKIWIHLIRNIHTLESKRNTKWKVAFLLGKSVDRWILYPRIQCYALLAKKNNIWQIYLICIYRNGISAFVQFSYLIIANYDMYTDFSR